MSFPTHSTNTPIVAPAATRPMVKPVVVNTIPVPAALPTSPATALPQTVNIQQQRPFTLPPTPPEDPSIPLKSWLLGALAGLPFMLAMEAAYKGLGTGNSLVERGLTFFDSFPVIKQVGQFIDWVGLKYSEAGAKKKPLWLQRFADYVNPSVDQFFQRKLPGEVLHDHTNDFLNLVDHLAPTAEAKTGLQTLKKAIEEHAATYIEKAKQIKLEDYTNAPGHSLHESELLLNNITNEVHSHVGWAETGLDKPLIDEAVLKANRSKLLNSFGITEAELTAAGFRGNKLTLLQEGKSLKAIQGELSQGFFKRLFRLNVQEKRAAQSLNTKLAQAVKYQRRLVGVTERLAGMQQLFIPVYEADRVLRNSLTNKNVGAVSRFIGALINDVRDSISGAFIGVKHSGEPLKWISNWFGTKAGRAAGKATIWLVPMLLISQLLKAPFEAAFKAEKGDKAKSFAYKLITVEIPLTLAFIIGVKYLHEISFIKHAGTLLKFIGRNVGISPWLKGLGNLATQGGFTGVGRTLATIAKPFERFNIGRVTSRFFAMTGKLGPLGRITLGGFILTAILPSTIFGSRFEKRFTWLAKHSIGTPKSVRKAKADEKAAEAAALKQKLPAAFFNQRTEASKLASQNPFGAPMVPTTGGYTPSSLMPANGPQAGLPVAKGFKQLLATQQGPLGLANANSASAATRGLNDNRTSAGATANIPTSKTDVDNHVVNPFDKFITNSINPVATDLIAEDEILKLKTEAYIKENGLEELVGSHH